jgi:hypothetical protein
VDDLVRLVYASKAVQDNNAAGQEIAFTLGEILPHARHHNAQMEIGGVLFYDNGYFFQCLEGQRDVVMTTYERISKDVRHQNPKVLLHAFTKRHLFPEWSMKYVPAQENFRAFLAQHDLTEFAPFDYDHEMVGRLLIFLQQAKESGEFAEKIIEKKSSEIEAPPPKPKSAWRRLFSF